MDPEHMTNPPAGDPSGPQEPPAPPAEPGPEPPAEPEAPPTLAQLLQQRPELQEEYDARLAEVRQGWEAEAQAQLNQARVEDAIQAAAQHSGAHDPQVLALLIDRSRVTVENGQVTGLAEQLERLRQERGWLWPDQGGKPYFGPTSGGQAPIAAAEARVAQRYQGNPWYHK